MWNLGWILRPLPLLGEISDRKPVRTWHAESVTESISQFSILWPEDAVAVRLRRTVSATLHTVQGPPRQGRGAEGTAYGCRNQSLGTQSLHSTLWQGFMVEGVQ